MIFRAAGAEVRPETYKKHCVFLHFEQQVPCGCCCGLVTWWPLLWPCVAKPLCFTYDLIKLLKVWPPYLRPSEKSRGPLGRCRSCVLLFFRATGASWLLLWPCGLVAPLVALWRPSWPCGCWCGPCGRSCGRSCGLVSALVALRQLLWPCGRSCGLVAALVACLPRRAWEVPPHTLEAKTAKAVSKSAIFW